MLSTSHIAVSLDWQHLGKELREGIETKTIIRWGQICLATSKFVWICVVGDFKVSNIDRNAEDVHNKDYNLLTQSITVK